MKRNTMKRALALTALAVVFTTFVLSVSVTAHADDDACSLARAAGKYGFLASGTVIGIGPRAALALLTLDAAGNISGPVTGSLNGLVFSTKLSGTYTVNRDCTGTTNFAEFDPSSGNLLLTATVNLVWDDNMREIRFIFTSAVLANGTPLATAINGSARKQVR